MKKSASVIQPIFFVGMGRSGTTIMFEALTQHTDLAWPSNYCEWMPHYLFMNRLVPLLDRVGLRGHKKQYSRAIPGNRYLPRPDEAYEFWDYYSRENFSRSYLNGLKANPETINRVRNAVARLTHWQQKSRFSAKLTGPGRISFLASIFPDARFIHIIRDGRSVVESLLRQRFWQEKGGLERPFWEDTPDHILQEWEASGRDSEVLAALQWRYIIQSIRADVAELPKESYMEVRYEDFVQDPTQTLKSIYHFTDLSIPEDVLNSPESDGNSFKNMNEKWREMEKEHLDRITTAMQPVLRDLGYE